MDADGLGQREQRIIVKLFARLITVRVDIPDLGISLTGVGKSRRQAEQDAAQKALDSEAIRNLKG